MLSRQPDRQLHSVKKIQDYQTTWQQTCKTRVSATANHDIKYKVKGQENCAGNDQKFSKRLPFKINNSCNQ